LPLILTLLLLAGLLGTSAHGHDDGRAPTGCAVCQLASTTPIGAPEVSTGIGPVPVLSVSMLAPTLRFHSRELHAGSQRPRAPPAPTFDGC